MNKSWRWGSNVAEAQRLRHKPLVIGPGPQRPPGYRPVLIEEGLFEEDPRGSKQIYSSLLCRAGATLIYK